MYARPLKSQNLTLAPVPKRFKIIINPKSGKGKAKNIFKNDVLPILQAAGCKVVEHITSDRNGVSHVLTTNAAKEATAVAAQLDLQYYDAILCVGGDGIVHEVINGLANRKDGGDALNSIYIAAIPAGAVIL